MSRLSFSHPAIRAAFITFLLVLPLATGWNLAVAPYHPNLKIKLGPQLAGVTRLQPLEWNWSSLADGKLQKAITDRIIQALPIHPLLVRLNNQLRFTLFGLTGPGIVRGTNGQLLEQVYLDDYCSRTESLAATRAAAVLPHLEALKRHYRSRGAVFLYLVTPSKIAHMPEYFVNDIPCLSTPDARTQFVSRYVALLKQAGIDVLDLASFTHALKGAYEIELFPATGVHWNEIGGARAATMIAEAINRQAGRLLVPPFTFTYKISSTASAVDREVADLLNIFFPPRIYQTPKVTFQPATECASSPAPTINAIMVGSSFSHLPAEILIRANCLAALNMYFYLKLGRFGGEPYHYLAPTLKDEDTARLRDATIMITEENEFFVGAGGYIEALRNLIGTN